MRIHIPLLVLSLSTCGSCVLSSCSADSQLEGLQHVYQGWKGDDWRSAEGWLDLTGSCEPEGVSGLNISSLPAHCCWRGVTCSLTEECTGQGQLNKCGAAPGLVTEIILSSNNLVGDFAAFNHSAFACSLKGLKLADNALSGEIPPDFGILRKLAWADLSRNRLTGRLPQGIGQMPSLEVLVLGSNALDGPLPGDLCSNASRLFSLLIQDNNFTGTLDISLCKRLNYIVANGNNFVKLANPTAHPTMLGIYLQDNQLSGSLSKDFFFDSFPNLEELFLDNNNLTGYLPELPLNSLGRLTLAANPFVGPIPASWQNLVKPNLDLLSLDMMLIHCCGTNPLQPADLLIRAKDASRANRTLRIDDVYGGVDYAAPLLPPFLKLSDNPDDLEPVFVSSNQHFNPTALRCPKLLMNLDGVDTPASADLYLDPTYYMFSGCVCDEGMQLVNVTRPGKVFYFECQTPSQAADQSWVEAYPWAVVIIIVVGCLLLSVLLVGFYLYKGTEILQRVHDLRKRMKGLPDSGPFTAVVTDIEGWSALCAEHPELSVKVLSQHNSIMRKARWNNFGCTHSTEGDSYIMIFYDAQDAASFCLQAQQMLAQQQWPSPKKHESDGASVPSRGIQSSPFHSSGNNIYQGKSGSVNTPLLAPSGRSIFNALSTSRKLMRNNTQGEPALDIRVRMGLASGYLQPGTDLHGHPTVEAAREVSEAAAGGQVFLEGNTYQAIKESLGELGTVDTQGMHLDRMRMRRVLDWSGFFLCRCFPHAPSSEDAVVLDMGCYEKPLSVEEQNRPRQARDRHSSSRMSLTRFSTRRSRGLPQKHTHRELHLFQLLSPCNAERAKEWGSAVRLRSEWALKDVGYFDAPGTMAAPLGNIKRDLTSGLPPVTIVFAGVECGKAMSSRDTRLVEANLLACTQKCLEQVRDGESYLCRVFDNLKLMLCFSKPQAALAWSCAMQECMMVQAWPRTLCRDTYDRQNNLVFRGPRLKIGISEGRPESIQPDHVGRADYHGDCVNCAARFLDGAAQGGMVVCEQELALKVMTASSLSSKEQPTDPDHITASIKSCHERSHSDPSSARSSFAGQNPSEMPHEPLPSSLCRSFTRKPACLMEPESLGSKKPSVSVRAPMRSTPPLRCKLESNEIDNGLPQLVPTPVHVHWLGLYRFKGSSHVRKMVHVLQDNLASRKEAFLCPSRCSSTSATLVSRMKPEPLPTTTFSLALPMAVQLARQSLSGRESMVQSEGHSEPDGHPAKLIRFLEVEVKESGCEHGNGCEHGRWTPRSVLRRLSGFPQVARNSAGAPSQHASQEITV